MNKTAFWAQCLGNCAYPASLQLGKFYALKQDLKAMQRGFLRGVDDSGEDYLYPEALFGFGHAECVFKSKG